MAKQLRHYQFKSGRPTPRGYDWKTWLDGNVWELTRGVDFHCHPGSLRPLAYTAAAKLGKKVHVAILEDDRVVLQAYEAP